MAADALDRARGQSLPEGERPQVVVASPYVRAMQTARHVHEAVAQAALGAGGEPPVFSLDGRLCEKEFGTLARLARIGIRGPHPELTEQMTHVGKFCFRPPGGESGCDVIPRLRSFLEMITGEHRGERVAIVGHSG